MKKNFFKTIIAGGLLDLSEQNILIRKRQIEDGLIIHTCNDYKDSLEVIKEASFDLKHNLKIISKIYYKYPDIQHRRFRPLYKQLEELVQRIGFIPKVWEIQICCFCPVKDLISIEAQKFFFNIKDNFGIKKIFLETYPVYNFKTKEILFLNNFYKGNSFFGLMGYQNLKNRVFDDKFLDKFAMNSLDIIFIGMLGKGRQNKFFVNKDNPDFINMNILYFLVNLNMNPNIKGITGFSNIRQYEDFKSRFNHLQELLFKDHSIGSNIQSINGKINYYKNYDHYGGHYSFVNYLKRPKLILFKIKYLILSFLKSLKFSNNFFGQSSLDIDIIRTLKI